MSSQRKSNDFQRAEAAYRFGDFALFPAERLLTHSGQALSLTPKAFDALLCLVSKAGRLVQKAELMDTLWPSTFVSDASLTNLIVSLRKLLPENAIQTVSKHGYRFTMCVEGEPGIDPGVYQTFTRARELTLQRNIESMMKARELYWVCVAEDPNFAAAWAWLGRCTAFLAKVSSATADAQVAESAFKRAFALDPDLACAHHFYTAFEVDRGNARAALARLRRRVSSSNAEPESLAGLVQVLRYCGLLDESLSAHNQAKALDPALFTSVTHTHFLAGRYEESIESYNAPKGYYLDAAAWAAMGNHQHAAEMLRDRLRPENESSISRMMRRAMKSLLAITEGRRDEVLALVEADKEVREPEVLVYLARHYSYASAPDHALEAITRAERAGFVIAPQTLCNDPWLEAVRKDPKFPEVLAHAEMLTDEARMA